MMLFLDFLGSIESENTLSQIHFIVKNHFCFNYNIQCMEDENEYFHQLEQQRDNMYVAEKLPGVYIVYHAGKKVLSINFNDGFVWAIT